MERCRWSECDPLMIEYHDKEWGVPLYDDVRHFEYLSLEAMQCGLSWLTVLRRREVMRSCFDGFDPAKVALYDEADVARILATEGMIRSERKIRAIIGNARCFLEIQKEYGSFSDYIWSFTDGKVMRYPGHENGSFIVARNELSDLISCELRKRGFSYLGSVTVYAYLQSCGIINDHLEYCFRYGEAAQ